MRLLDIQVYWQDDENKGVMTHNADTAIKVATSAGASMYSECTKLDQH